MKADLVITGNLATHDDVFKNISIAIKDGKIISLGEKSSMPPAEKELDYSEFLILPGVVDAHVHSLGDKDEGIFNATYAAAAGGTTTINDHPLDIGGAPTSKNDILKKAEKAAIEAVVDFSLFASAVPHKMEDIADVADSGITGYKCLMHATSGASTYGLGAVNDGEFYAILEEIAKVGQRVFVHAENDWIVNMLENRYQKAGEISLPDHTAVRPKVEELVAAYTAVELAADLGCKLHIVHVSMPEIFDLIESVRERGAKVTGETCPHYLIFTEEKWRDIGAQYKINPPLRPEESRLGMWKKLKAGKITLVATDHAPHPENHYPNVFDNFSGSPGVETNLLVMYNEGVAKGRISISDLVRLLSYHPAKLLGLYPQKGAIEVGADADFVVFDPEKEWTLTADKLHMQAGWTMYESMKVKGQVQATYVRGTIVYEEGTVVGKKGYGKWIKKTRNYDL
jgi:allantoinase